jgi:hypothetical protein
LTALITNIPPSVDATIVDGWRGPKDGVPDDMITNLGISVGDHPQFEYRGIIEFDISSLSQPVGLATLHLPVHGSMGPFPFGIDVFVYTGDGAITLSDFSAGSLFTSFDYAGGLSVTLNVTPAINALIMSGARAAGFNFQFAVPSPIEQKRALRCL